MNRGGTWKSAPETDGFMTLPPPALVDFVCHQVRRGRQAQQRLKFYMSTFEKRFAILGHRGHRFTTGALRQMCAARINIVIRETITSRTKVLRGLIVPPVLSHFVYFGATLKCVCIQLQSMIVCYYTSWESREQQTLRGKTNSFEFYPITVGLFCKSGQSWSMDPPHTHTHKPCVTHATSCL